MAIRANGYIRRTCHGFSLFTDENELVASEAFKRGTVGLESLAKDLRMRTPVTPYNAPGRFTDEERNMFLAGECGYQTAFGMPWTEYCHEPSNPLADFGFCTEHATGGIMTDPDIIESNDRYRVYVEYDLFAEEPYYECGAPVLRIEKRGFASSGSVEHIDSGGKHSYPRASDDAIENAILHWGATPSNEEWKLVEKYLRAFFGTTKIDTWSSDDYWYVGYDTAAWRETTGILPDHKITEDFLEEIRAWATGEVYTVVIEHNRTGRKVWDDGDDDEPFDIWEYETSCGGFYGYEYAEAEAREMFDAYRR